MEIPTSPQTAAMRHARSALAALADAQPGVSALPAIRALLELDLVCPPYPPVAHLEPGTPAGHDEAIRALAAAARVAVDPAEAARIALAAEALTSPVPG